MSEVNTFSLDSTRDLLIIYDGVDSTSTTEAASANSVRIAYEKAVEALNYARGIQIPTIPEEVDTGWLTPEYTGDVTGYSANYPCKYRKVGKMVEMKGAVAGVVARNTPLFTLPEGMRPNSKTYRVCATSNGLSYTMQIDASGVVTCLTDAQGYTSGKYYFVDTVFFID